jgi:hypothetical protein
VTLSTLACRGVVRFTPHLPLRRARFGSGSPVRASCVRLLPEPRHGRFLSVPPERCRASDDPSPRGWSIASSATDPATKLSPRRCPAVSRPAPRVSREGSARFPIRTAFRRRGPPSPGGSWPRDFHPAAGGRARARPPRSRSGCDPGAVRSSPSFHPRRPSTSRWLSAFRPSPLARTGVCQLELLGPTTPDDFCSCQRPTDAAASPNPRRAPAYVLADYDRHRASAIPRTAGARPSNSRPRTRSVAAPLIRHRPSTLRRSPALSRTGSGPRSLSGSPRPGFLHARANET